MRKHPVIAIFTALLIVAVVVVVIILGHLYNWNWDWTGFTASTNPSPTVVIYQPGKTLWDWLQLLIIPIVLAVGGYIFNVALQEREEKTTTANQEEAALQSYLKNMSELLLHKSPSEDSTEKNTREKIMRAYTLTTLQLLKSPDRKRSLFLFLQDTNLISKDERIGHLKGANLSGIRLSAMELPKVDLADTFLGGSNLSGTILSDANLSRALLVSADLSRTNLTNANLTDADLTNADLTNANLSGAILNRTKLYLARVIPEQLEQALTLADAIMPDNSKHN
jgi:uncharacterized protein YjbI with pentapeptide repeats